MKIESIGLKNYKAFRDVQMEDLPRFCVVVGSNGSGKTTLFDVFGFLRDCLTHNVTRALGARGGFKEVISRGCDEHQSIGIELKYRMQIAGKERLVTYHLEIGYQSGQVIVEREVLRYKRGAYGSPFHFLDFRRGHGYAITNEEDFDRPDEELDREEQDLDGMDMLAIKGLGQFQRFKAANAFRHMIEHWHVSDFHINLARGSKDVIGYSDHLSETGDNLQLVANQLYEQHREDVFQKIVKAMEHRVPGVSAVKPIPSPDGRLILSFEDGSFKDPFIDKYVSDGTLKMFAYLVLLYDPKPHPLLCIEEPENQLYPRLLAELAEEFRSYADRGDGQVLVSTHSPDFLNACELDEVYWLAKQSGYTKIQRAGNDQQIRQFMSEGDQMGYLWKQGFLPGVDP